MIRRHEVYGVLLSGAFLLPALASNSRILNLRQFGATGGRVDWLSSRNIIAFDRAGSDGYFDVYASNPDGSNERCLTCNSLSLPNKHIGNPAWHPSGDYLAIQVQKATASLGVLADQYAVPGIGLNNDLWIMDSSGQRFWQITNVLQGVGGVLHAHFSHKGDRIIWAERISNSNGSSGTWTIRVADFAVSAAGPVVANVRSLQPGSNPRFYETHGFSRDDSEIYFTSNSDGQAETGYDIYVLNLSTGAMRNLTNTPNDWDEHAQLSPDGESIIWISSTGQPIIPGSNVLRTDYWIMRPDGSSKARLTFYSDPNQPEYILQPVSVGDASWNGDGTAFIYFLITDNLGANGRNYVADLSSAVTVSSASFSGYAVAPDSIATIFGKSIADHAEVAGSLPLPTRLAGASVVFTDSQGKSRSAPIVSISSGQINVQVPSDLAAGTARVQVSTSAGSTLNGRFEIMRTAAGVYTANSSGTGPPAAFIQHQRANGSVPPQEPAFTCPSGVAGDCIPAVIDLGASGDRTFVSLFVTGLRGKLADPIVSVGGVNVPIQFAGPQGQFLSLDQLNFEIPASLRGRGAVTVNVTVDGRAANPVSLSIR